jgi:SlyX protein
MEDRITDLEIRMSHQQAAIDELTHTVLEQEKLIENLQRDIKQLHQQLTEFSNIAHISEETPPPHY